jgi:hypothetical protein
LRQRRFALEVVPVSAPTRRLPDIPALLADVVGSSPAATVRLALTVLRDEGMPFEIAFSAALHHVGRDKRMLQELRPAFQAGFDRQPSSVAALHELLEERAA